ncbi:Septin-domain-containing protein [Globomyces pollinis-pini]|nr:Septin-domain-containing protein [Globomyces pollinis-pini]
MRPSASIGIDDLPNQQAKRSKRRPYSFNIMVAGESGLGKTTFLNTLFNAPLTEQIVPQHLLSSKTVDIVPTTFDLNEEGVSLQLTVIDTPGFGDQLNRETNFEPIINYIEKQHDKYFEAEKAVQIRGTIPDTRVHCLLYFLPPYGNQRVKDLDAEFLQRICSKVNVVPVIAKADSLSPEEISIYKRAILRDLEQHDIRCYPTYHSEDREMIAQLEQYIPFSVIGSDKLINVGGKMVRGRTYRWGSCEVENPLHCDFVHLREMLISTNMQDLIDTTHSTHYAAYRGVKIRGKGRPESFLACDEFYESRIENAKRSLAEEMQKKEEAMRQRFVGKVREKEQTLRYYSLF